MTKTLEFFFDLGSPAAYLAYTQLPSLVQETGADLIYRPMLLGGVFRAVGNATPMAIPAKGRYLLQDLSRYARRYDVPLMICAGFPINTLVLMRIASALQLRGDARFLPYVSAVYDALFGRGLDLSDEATVEADLAGGRPGRRSTLDDGVGGAGESAAEGCDRGRGGARGLRRADHVRGRCDVFRAGPPRFRSRSPPVRARARANPHLSTIARRSPTSP